MKFQHDKFTSKYFDQGIYDKTKPEMEKLSPLQNSARSAQSKVDSDKILWLVLTGAPRIMMRHKSFYFFTQHNTTMSQPQANQHTLSIPIFIPIF